MRLLSKKQKKAAAQDSATITSVVNFGGADYNRLACESHRHGARAILGASDIPDITGKALSLLNASWRAGWVASNVRSMGLTSKDGFDGLALDIEDFAGNATLRDALTSLVCELRAAMTAALPGSQLSFAAAADPATNAEHYDYAGIARCLEAGDFIFPMGYCMSEAKHTNVGSPNSPLPAVKRGLTNYLQLGVKASNLVLGLPFFGFDVPCVDNASEAGCTIEPGSWSTSQFEAGYGTIQEVIPLAGGAEALRWNDSAASPWFDYHKRGSKGLERHRVYFDDPRSIGAKVSMAAAAGVKGIGVWTATALPYTTDPTAAQAMWAAVKTDDHSVRPHLMLIVADDFGYANLGLHSTDPAGARATPTLDSLARSGVQLSQHYVFQYCGPSRSSLLTGRLPGHVTQDNDHIAKPGSGIPLHMSTISSKLHEAGYRTGFAGKCELTFVSTAGRALLSQRCCLRDVARGQGITGSRHLATRRSAEAFRARGASCRRARITIRRGSGEQALPTMCLSARSARSSLTGRWGLMTTSVEVTRSVGTFGRGTRRRMVPLWISPRLPAATVSESATKAGALYPAV